MECRLQEGGGTTLNDRAVLRVGGTMSYPGGYVSVWGAFNDGDTRTMSMSYSLASRQSRGKVRRRSAREALRANRRRGCRRRGARVSRGVWLA